MKAKSFLSFSRGLMVLLLAWGILSPGSLQDVMRKPELYLYLKFIHILAVTLFLSTAIIGTIWEARALFSNNIAIMSFMFKTMLWFDDAFTSPLIFVGVLSGLMLGTSMGGIWSQGWMSLAFVLLIFAGAVWVIADLPMQYKLVRLFSEHERTQNISPEQFRKLYRQRMVVNILGTAPLLVIFGLMVFKPDIPRIANLWLGATGKIPAAKFETGARG